MSKKLKLISITFAVIFILFFCFVYFGQIVSAIVGNNQLSTKQDYITNFNNEVTNENSSNYTVENNNNQQTVYSNAKTAVQQSFEIFYQMKKYELQCSSVATITALGQTVVMDAYTSISKYTDETYLLYSLRYQRPHPIDSLYNLGLSSGDIYYFANGSKYRQWTGVINKSGDKLVPTWSSNRVGKQGPITTDSYLYVVNNSTIIRELYFEPVYNPITKKLKNYYVSVELNAPYATKDYRKIFIEQTGNENVYFNKLVLHCVLDAEGKLVSFRTEEKYTITATLLGVPLTAYISQTNSFKLINEPQFKQPVLINSTSYSVEV